MNKICDPSTLAAAWERIKNNGGCRGADGVTLNRFEYNLDRNLKELSKSLTEQRYHPFPLLRFAIPKRNAAGVRFLSVPTVRDRVAQTAVFLITQPFFEAEFEVVSHGYRPGRGVRTAVYDIKAWRDKGYRFAVDADIDSYFDSVPHDILAQKLSKLFQEPWLLRLFEKWIKVEIYDGEKISTLSKGIPQGSVVSPYLANLVLDILDETLMSFNLKLVRYADDFLILCKDENDANDAIELTDMLLEDMRLNLNPVKTKIVSFDEGFKFLGAIFLHDGVYLPFPEKRAKHTPPKFPPPLTFKRYLELRNMGSGGTDVKTTP